MSELQARPGSSTDVRTTGVPQVPGPDPSFPSIRLGPPAGSGAKFNNGSFRTGAPTARRFGQVRSRKRPAGVLYDLGDWSWDCLDDCTAACLGCRTVDHGGSSGYACGCTAAEDPDCRDMVFSPDTPRKASRAGHWGGASCDPGDHLRRGGLRSLPGRGGLRFGWHPGRVVRQGDQLRPTRRCGPLASPTHGKRGPGCRGWRCGLNSDLAQGRSNMGSSQRPQGGRRVMTIKHRILACLLLAALFFRGPGSTSGNGVLSVGRPMRSCPAVGWRRVALKVSRPRNRETSARSSCRQPSQKLAPFSLRTLLETR
jgi:hypothetical protein